METSVEGGVGLALGAGGMVGHAWHSGVLAALAEGLGWDARTADLVVGTSAGSVVTALLRADMAPADLLARITGDPLSESGRRIVASGLGTRPPVTPSFEVPRRWAPASPGTVLRAFNPFNPRFGGLTGALPRGTTDSSMISQGIGRLHGGGWPSRPTWVCAARLRDGRRVVFGRDRTDVGVGEAVAASCAIPGYFSPVTIDGVEYVDGGVHSPTNVELLAGLGLRLVIVSSPMSLDRAAARRPRADRAFRLAHRATLLREVAAVRRRGATVVSFQPGADDLAAMGTSSAAMRPERREPVARQARETTLRRLQRSEVRDALASVSA